jgi:predicted RNA polymerase sigma factor
MPAQPSNEDDSLVLIFLCCHPVLGPGSAIPLTLRAVGGLSTAEIAAAFLVPEDTMAKRISRAKQRIRTSQVPFRMPTPVEWNDRLRSILHVLYLIFNEGYAASTGPRVVRVDLSTEAIRLTRTLSAALPDEPDKPEVAGLLALTLLTDARPDRPGRPTRPARRAGPHPLEPDAHRRGNRAAVSRAAPASRRRVPTPGGHRWVHDEAATADETDWPQILALYGLLERMTGNPMSR